MLEVGEALTNDILKQVWECIDRHHTIIDEPEFCIVMQRAEDPLIKNIMRRKFYAWPYLPSPRPEQTVFHYQKLDDSVTRLWSLPSAKVMAVISEMPYVAKPWELTKFWCDAFFSQTFWEAIRHQHGIKLLSESEYLNLNQEALIQAGCNRVVAPDAYAFDFSQVTNGQIANPIDPLFRENFVNSIGQTQNAKGNISA